VSKKDGLELKINRSSLFYMQIATLYKIINNFAKYSVRLFHEDSQTDGTYLFCYLRFIQQIL